MIRDDYEAKYRLWVEKPLAVRIPRAVGLPPIRSRRFNSYEEFNRWKREYLKRIAEQGGVRWSV